MVHVKKDRGGSLLSRICRCSCGPKKLILASVSLILLLHFVLLAVQWADSSLSGRAKRWLKWHHIPSLKRRSGIVVFVHMRRTGGDTIKRNLNKMDFGIVFRHPHLTTSLVRQESEMEVILNATRKSSFRQERTTQFVVLHDSLGYMSNIKGLLERWRLLAREHKTNLFMFTILRDPVDYHVSCFNEYRVPPCERDICKRPLLEPTPINLLQTIQPNDQCAGLVRPPGNETPVTDSECHDVYDWMTQHLDWIGTTDTLNTYTLPLLAEYMLGDADRSDGMKIFNDQVKTNKLASSSLDEPTKRQIRQQSSLDQQLYDQVKSTYYF